MEELSLLSRDHFKIKQDDQPECGDEVLCDTGREKGDGKDWIDVVQQMSANRGSKGNGTLLKCMIDY